MRYYDNVVELIGNTPLVRLHGVAAGIPATVLAKLEYLNPGGSVKDRIAVRMVDEAEKSGQLQPGGTIVEPTSGNTGVGLALVAQLRGYHCVFGAVPPVTARRRCLRERDGPPGQPRLAEQEYRGEHPGQPDTTAAVSDPACPAHTTPYWDLQK